MKNIKISTTLLSASALTIFSFTPAQATLEDHGIDISATVSAVSEYSFRGIAQSDEHPTAQGSIDIGHESGLYAGAWASGVDFNDGGEADVEVDFYAGYASAIEKINYDMGVIYYTYPGAASGLDYNFWEVALSLGYDFENFSVSSSVNYSPDYFAASGEAYYVSFGAAAPLPYDLVLSGQVGHQSVEDGFLFGFPDYYDWNIGLGYNLKGFDLSLNYIDTDLNNVECADGCDAKVIFSISKSF